MSQQINLFNPDFRRKRELFTAHMLVQAGTGLLVLLLAVYALEFRQTQALDKAVKSNAALLEQEQQRLAKEAAAHAAPPKNVVLEKRVEELEREVAGNESLLAVLQGGSLGNTRGYSDYLRALARQIVNGVWLTDFSIKGAGLEMSIGGRALRPELVPAYIRRLNQEETLKGLAFATLEMQPPKLAPAAQGTPAPAPNFIEFKLQSSPSEVSR